MATTIRKLYTQALKDLDRAQRTIELLKPHVETEKTAERIIAGMKRGPYKKRKHNAKTLKLGRKKLHWTQTPAGRKRVAGFVRARHRAAARKGPLRVAADTGRNAAGSAGGGGQR